MIYASSSIMDAMLRKRSCIYCTGDGKKPKIHLFRGAFACSTWAQETFESTYVLLKHSRDIVLRGDSNLKLLAVAQLDHVGPK